VSMLLHATADDLASNTFKAANNVVVLFLM
jgi:hypothetical protein